MVAFVEMCERNGNELDNHVIRERRERNARTERVRKSKIE